MDHVSQGKYWILLGLSVGLGLLTKYTMAFFPLCALCFLVASRHHRKFLGNPGPYLSLILSGIAFSPVVIWNARHDWVTIRHTAGQAHVAEGLQLSLKSFIEFVGSQIGVITPILFVMMVIALWKIRRTETVIARSPAPRGTTKQSHSSEVASPEPAQSETSRLLHFARNDKSEGTRNDKSEGTRNDKADNRGALLFWFSVPVILFFLMKSIQGKVQANWAMTGYLTGIVAFSEVFISRWKTHRPPLKALITAGLALSLIVTVVAHDPAKFGIPVKLDPSSRLRGWEELGREVSTLHADLLKERNTFIFSDSYQVSSELAFYTKGKPITYCANLGRRMNQYDLWPSFEALIHYHGIFVTIGDRELHPPIREAFRSCEKRLLTVREKDRALREYSLFVCRDFKGIEKQPIGSY